jgi:hypothetical protein
VDEYTYYMDDDAYVTNRRVKLDWAEYDLADIKWIGVEEQVIGLRVGGLEVPPRVAAFITSYFFMIALFVLPTVFLPGDTHYAVRTLGFLTAWAAHGLVRRWLNRRKYRQYVLSMSGTFCLHHVMAATNEQHLKHIAEAIKRAVRERNASLQNANQEVRTP